MKGVIPKRIVDGNRAGDVYLIYYRVRSTREQEKESKAKALIGRPNQGESLFSVITDAIDKQHAHASVLIDVAGASTGIFHSK